VFHDHGGHMSNQRASGGPLRCTAGAFLCIDRDSRLKGGAFSGILGLR
jgi:hypothetical protein